MQPSGCSFGEGIAVVKQFLPRPPGGCVDRFDPVVKWLNALRRCQNVQLITNRPSWVPYESECAGGTFMRHELCRVNRRGLWVAVAMIAVIGGASLISGSAESIKASTGAPLRLIRKEKCGNALLYVYANSDFVLLNWQTTNGNSPYQVVSAKLINLSSNLEVEAPCSQRYVRSSGLSVLLVLSSTCVADVSQHAIQTASLYGLGIATGLVRQSLLFLCQQSSVRSKLICGSRPLTIRVRASFSAEMSARGADLLQRNGCG